MIIISYGGGGTIIVTDLSGFYVPKKSNIILLEHILKWNIDASYPTFWDQMFFPSISVRIERLRQMPLYEMNISFRSKIFSFPSWPASAVAVYPSI